MRVLKTARGPVNDVAFSPDGRAVAAAVGSAGVFLWNLDSPAAAPVRLEDGRWYYRDVRFSADGRRVYWVSHDGEFAYDRDARTTAREVRPVLMAAFSGDRARAVSNVRLPEHNLIGWQFKENEWVRQWQMSTRELAAASIILAPAGDRFVMLTRATGGGQWWRKPMRLEVRDAATGAELAAGTYPYSYAAKLYFHPRGEQVAGLNGMTLLAWELPAGGDPRRVQNDSRKHFTALAYHPDGRRLFATSNDETVHVFDAHVLARVTRYTWQLNRLSAVAVSPDGLLAAAGSATGDVVVWDLE